jgi:hypothetical protein
MLGYDDRTLVKIKDAPCTKAVHVVRQETDYAWEEVETDRVWKDAIGEYTKLLSCEVLVLIGGE